MPQFHETGYGRKFFEADLPRLVRALERIATQLEANNKTDKPDTQDQQTGQEEA